VYEPRLRSTTHFGSHKWSEERDGGRRVIGKPWRKRSGRALTAPPTSALTSPSGSKNLVRVSLSCGVFINQISYRRSLLAMVMTNNIHMAHAEPDGVERGEEGKRQHRANGSASDQHISHGSPEH